MISTIGVAIVNAAITLLQALIKQESGFITEEVQGVVGEGEASLSILFDSSISLAQKELLWKKAGATIKAAIAKAEDEAAKLPADVGTTVMPIVLKLLEVDFQTLL